MLKVHHQSETAVATGTPLLEIGDTARMEIVAELLTTDALQAVPGSAVRIERWGGPTVLQGRVRRVEPAAFTKVSALGVEEQRVNVLIDITSPAAEWAALGDGYRVGVRIVTRSEAAVLRVPVSAVFPLPAGAGGAGAPGSAVFVLDGGRARLQPVTVGARNGSEAWIQRGRGCRGPGADLPAGRCGRRHAGSGAGGLRHQREGVATRRSALPRPPQVPSGMNRYSVVDHCAPAPGRRRAAQDPDPPPPGRLARAAAERTRQPGHTGARLRRERLRASPGGIR